MHETRVEFSPGWWLFTATKPPLTFHSWPAGFQMSEQGQNHSDTKREVQVSLRFPTCNKPPTERCLVKLLLLLQKSTALIPQALLHCYTALKATEQTHSPDNNVVTSLWVFKVPQRRSSSDTGLKMYSLGVTVWQGYRNMKEHCERCEEIVCLWGRAGVQPPHSLLQETDGVKEDDRKLQG